MRCMDFIFAVELVELVERFAGRYQMIGIAKRNFPINFEDRLLKAAHVGRFGSQLQTTEKINFCFELENEIRESDGGLMIERRFKLDFQVKADEEREQHHF